MAGDAKFLPSLTGGDGLQQGALAQALSQVADPDSARRDEWLAFAGGMGAAPNPGASIATAMGSGIAAQSKQRQEHAMLQAQYMPMILQALGAQQSYLNEQAIRGGGMPGGGGMPAGGGQVAPTGPLSAGIAGPQGPQPIAPGIAPSNLMNMSPDTVQALKDYTLHDPSEMWKTVHELTKPKWENHNGYWINTNSPEFQGGFTPGVTQDANGHSMLQVTGPGGVPVVMPTPGSLEATSAFTRAQKGAESQFETMKVTVPDPSNPKGSVEVYLPKSVVLGAMPKPQGAPPAAGAPQGPASGAPGTPGPNGSVYGPNGHAMVPPSTQASMDADAGAQIIQKEYGGDVTKAKADVEQLDQIIAQAKGDKKGILQGYRDRLQAGIDSSSGASVAQAGTSTTSPTAAIPGMQAAPSTSQATATKAAETFAGQQAEAASKQKAGLDERVRTGMDLMQRLQESQDALAKFKAGGGADTRAQIAQMAQAIPGIPQKVVDGIAGGDLGAMQEFQKLSAQQAMETLKNAMASDNGMGGRMTQFEFQQFQKLNPNLSTDPRAIDKIFAFTQKMHARNFAEQQAFDKWIGDGNDPTRFSAAWAKQNNFKNGAPTNVATSEPTKTVTAAPMPLPANPSASTLTAGQSYLLPNGNSAVWDGEKFRGK